jgi:phosphoglycerol transferase
VRGKYLKLPGVQPSLLVAAEAAATFAVLFAGLEGWRRDFRVPLHFSSDALEYLMQVKGTLENGWWWVHPRLSAPGVFEQVLFPSSPQVDQAIVWVVGLFTDDVGLAINVSWMVMVVLSALVASRCLRCLNVSRRVAVPLGLLYAISPYALYRQVNHFSLATHLVPIASTVALLVVTGRLGPLRHRRVWPLLVGCALLGLNYTYYPFFSCFLILLATLVGAVSLRRWRDAGRGLVFVGVISLATAINLAPTMYARAADGEPTGPPQKRAAESEVYGLKIRQLVSPVYDHGFPWFRRWTDLEESAHFPLDDENQNDRLGLVMTAGFLALLGALFVPAVASMGTDPSMFLGASRLALGALLLATVGGFGSVQLAGVS